jgi:hypothetical protein
VAKWHRPNISLHTAGVIGVATMWSLFQWRVEHPPPILDQLLVASFGVWFTTEARIHTSKRKAAADDEDEPVEIHHHNDHDFDEGLGGE